MASAGQNFCAQRSNFPSPPSRRPVHHVTSIWVLLMWEMATQEFKFRNYFRTFSLTGSERMKRVCQSDKKKKKRKEEKKKKVKKKSGNAEKISSFDHFVYCARNSLNYNVLFQFGKKNHAFSICIRFE